MKCIGDEQKRTLSAELFIDCVLGNVEVWKKVKANAEDRENLRAVEAEHLGLVYEKLKEFGLDQHNAQMIEVLQRNLPN